MLHSGHDFFPFFSLSNVYVSALFTKSLENKNWNPYEKSDSHVYNRIEYK